MMKAYLLVATSSFSNINVSNTYMESNSNILNIRSDLELDHNCVITTMFDVCCCASVFTRHTQSLGEVKG